MRAVTVHHRHWGKGPTDLQGRGQPCLLTVSERAKGALPIIHGLEGSEPSPAKFRARVFRNRNIDFPRTLLFGHISPTFQPASPASQIAVRGAAKPDSQPGLSSSCRWMDRDACMPLHADERLEKK